MSRVGRALATHPWIVYAVLTAMCFPILEMIVSGEGALQYAHDVFDDDVPRLFSIAADWRANGPVLWDPHLTAGNALLAQFALPATAPDVLLSFVVPPFVAYAANYTLMTFAAGMSMHLFLRGALRMPAIACFAGGIIATFAFWHYIYGYAALCLPLVLWATDRAIAETRRRRDVLAVVLLVFFLMSSSQIQIVLIDGAFALAWVVAKPGPASERARRVAGLIAVWLTALLLAAPVLASQVASLPGSQRAIWDLGYLYPFGQELRDLAALYGGVLFGVPITNGVGGTAGFYGSFFLGPIGLALLVAGLVAPRRSVPERLMLWLLVAIPIIDLVALLAVPLQDHIAPLRTFQFIRIRHLLPVVLAVNAAIGLAWLAEPDPFGRLGRGRRVIAVIGLVGLGAAVAWQARVALRHVGRSGGSDLTQDGWELALIALAGGAVVVLMIGASALWETRRSTRSRATVTAGLAIVLLLGLAGERFIFARSERYLGRDLGTWADRVAPTPAHAFIAGQPGGGRVLSIGEHANRVLAGGLDGVDGYQVMYPLRYHELFGALIAPQLAVDPGRAAYYGGWGNRAYAFGPRYDPEVADLLGVRWLYVRGTPIDDPGLVVRFAGGDVTVYERVTAFPRTFIVHDVQVLADRAAVTAAIAVATGDDLRRRAYLASADTSTGDAPPAGPRDAAAAATVVTDGIDRIVIEARTSTPGLLVLADSYSPDWAADIDGIPADVLAVDGALRGVALSPGEHRITFSYRPVATSVGLVIAAFAAALLAGWLALGHRRDRASARPGPTPQRSPLSRSGSPPGAAPAGGSSPDRPGRRR